MVVSVNALTVRQKQVLALLLSGFTHAQIAEELVISQNTAKLHAQTVYARLGIADRQGRADRRALYAWAFAAGVLRIRL